MKIPDLDDSLVARLRERATLHGKTLEDEAHDILRSALSVDPPRPPQPLVEAIRACIAPLGGVELELPARDPAR